MARNTDVMGLATSTLRAGFWVVLGFAFLTAGAVDRLPLSIAAAMASLLVLPLGLPLLRLPNGVTVYGVAAGLVVYLTAVLALQAQPADPSSVAHAAWLPVREQLGHPVGAWSIAPAETAASLVAFFPILIFVAAGLLHPDQATAVTLLRRLSYLGLLFAVFGILQIFLFPETLGLSEKLYYVDSLTSTLVNRNSAGSMIGCSLLLSVGFAWHYWRAIRRGEFLGAIFSNRVEIRREHMRFVVFAAMALVEIVALALTKSRGALLSTACAGILLTLLLWSRRRRADAERPPWMVYAGWARLALAPVAVLLIASLFSEQATYRLQTQGTDEGRLCAYRSTWRGIIEHWPYGAGFNTFTQGFPAYRDADCAGIAGFWNAAHNSYLEALFGLGAFVVPVFIIGLGTLLGALGLAYRKRRSYRFAPAIGLSVLLLILLHSLVDFSIQIPAVGCFVAAIFAAAINIGFNRPSRPEMAEPAGPTAN